MNISDKEYKALLDTLADNLSLKAPELISEDTILNALAVKVAEMLQYNRDVFFQLMYKLDIDERKLQAAMTEQDISLGIARLIYERQLQRIISRNSNRPTEAEDSDLEW